MLDLVEKKVEQFEFGTFATIVCAVTSPPYDTLTIAIAGHPPPVVAAPGEPASYPKLELSTPIGAPTKEARRSTTIPLAPGAVVAFYTDGLIERRGESIEAGLARLQEAVSTEHPDRVAANIMRKLVGDTVPTDDIALMVLRRTPSENA